MSKTSAQRYNDKMHRIFDEARGLQKKHEVLNMLVRLTEKVRRAHEIQDSGTPLQPEDWSELNMLTKESRAIIEEHQKNG